jgi:hypothetical protein
MLWETYGEVGGGKEKGGKIRFHVRKAQEKDLVKELKHIQKQIQCS